MLHPPARRVSSIEETIQNSEQLLDLRMTLHDLSGVFVEREGKALLDRHRGSHRRYRTCAIGYCRRCLDHCYQQVNKRCAHERGAFLHRCWKGFAELVLPIGREGVHLATLFAGQWQVAGWEIHKPLPPGCSEQIDKLSLVKQESLGRLASLLETFAAGLLAEVDRLRGQSGPAISRREAIYRFIELHAAEPIGLGDLAAALHLSPSRTSHLVKQLTGSTFQDLLVSERIRKAQALLRSTDLPVGQIGRLVGIENDGYFSRLFKARVGRAPSRYRHQGPTSKDRPDIAQSSEERQNGPG